MRCRLSDFGECEEELTINRGAHWVAFCCTAHRKRWHYRTHIQPAIIEQANERAKEKLNNPPKPKLTLAELLAGANGNGDDYEYVPEKLSFAELGLGSPPKSNVEVHRRKLTANGDAR
jgi:hypothetical protein